MPTTLLAAHPDSYTQQVEFENIVSSKLIYYLHSLCQISADFSIQCISNEISMYFFPPSNMHIISYLHLVLGNNGYPISAYGNQSRFRCLSC